MRILPIVSATVALLAGSVDPTLAAGPFECPTMPLEDAKAAEVKALLPTGDAYDRIDRLSSAVAALKAAGASPVIVIDRLIASYCPLVAAESGLTDAQKTAKVMRFAARVTRTVYSPDDAATIVLDVALPSAMVAAIDAKAKAAGVSPDAWIRNTIAAALQ
jgi:hypothetical protein